MATEDAIAQIERAITALEAQRGLLGDVVVEAAIGPMREKLDALRAAAPAEEQRKQVTVLFADLVGFTRLSEQLDPEDVYRIQQAYFTAVTQPIATQGGWIEKYIGDAVVAVFGLPKALENDPDRALYAALEMQAALAELNQHLEETAGVRLEAPLQMRVGVNTGLVLVSQKSQADFDVTGDAVNLASRLQSAAPPGGVIISHDTYRHVRGAFDLQLLEPIQVKGKSESVQIYLALAAKPRSFRTRKRGVEGIETRMVGRQAELQALQNAYFMAIEDGERQMATVVGEPGLGKSRLLYEFENWVDLRPERIALFRGRARQETQRLPYRLLRDLFAFRFGVQDDDPLSRVWEKLEDGIAEAEMRSASEENRIAAHFIGQLTGYDFSQSPHIQAAADDPQQIRDRGLNYIIEYFKSIADRQPLLILLEDLHWADDSSLDSLARLALALHDQTALLVAAARSTLFERRPHWMEGQDFHLRIELHPLTRRESRLLVEDVLQKVEQVPEALRELLISNSEGNPFYLEELVKMLVEDGVITSGLDAWRVNLDRLGQAHIPPTLAGVLQARLDGLPETERAVLQQASVVGRVFWDKVVDYFNQGGELGFNPEADEQALLALREKEMVFRRDFSAFTGTGEYIFKHAILREVTYESLLKRLRRLYHGLTADWLMEQGGQRQRELTGLIADHLEQAGRTQDALTFLHKAGHDAMASFANREAIEYFSRALALTPGEDVRRRLELLLEREDLYYLLGERSQEKSDLETMNQVLDNSRSAKPETDLFAAEIFYRQARFALAVGEFKQVAAEAEQAVHLARELDQSKIEALCYPVWASALLAMADYDAARLRAEEGLAIARRSGDREGQSRALNMLGVIAMDQADLDTARGYLEESLELLAESSNQRYQTSTRSNLAQLAGLQGDLSTARSEYQIVLRIFHEIGDRAGQANASGNLSWVYGLLGDYKSAYQNASQQKHVRLEIGRGIEEIMALVNMSEFARLLGDLPAAVEHARTSLQFAIEQHVVFWQAWSLTVLGHALFEEGKLVEAGQAYQGALAIRRQLNHPNLACEPLAGLARTALAQNELTEAMVHTEEILSFLGAGGTLDGTDEPLRVLLSIVQALQAVRNPRAAVILDQAHSRLLEQAARIQDEPSQRGYLENVPWHREILRLWQECNRQ